MQIVMKMQNIRKLLENSIFLNQKTLPIEVSLSKKNTYYNKR